MDEGGTRALERSTVRAVGRRLLPLLGLVYLVAYVDRQNVSYAKLEMTADLGLSEAAYGLGASLFFLGYFLFEVPSNLVLEKVGARLWFARIMATWGAVTVALGFTQSPEMFYLLRFLLGAAEAGFFPGVLYALTLWFPAGERAKAVGSFMLWSAAANAVGAAIGGALLDLDGLLGLKGWQWVFIATGLPAILLVPVVLRALPEGPERARWLSEAQKAWLADTLARERAATPAESGHPLKVLIDPRVLTLCALYVGFPLAAYGLGYWLPTIVKGFGVSNTVNGLINVLPWTVVGLALWLVPKAAARSRAPGRWILGPALVGAAALALSVVVPGAAAKLALLCVAAAGVFSAQPTFWTLPPRFLTGAGAAAGFAAVNSVGNLGGFVAQNAVPRIRDATGSDLLPLFFLAAAVALAGVAAFFVERRLPRPVERPAP